MIAYGLSHVKMGRLPSRPLPEPRQTMARKASKPQHVEPEDEGQETLEQDATDGKATT